MTDTLGFTDLKEFQPTDLTIGANKLYFLEVKEKPGMVKVGDTHQWENENDGYLI
jgi:hypothetical protein